VVCEDVGVGTVAGISYTFTLNIKPHLKMVNIVTLL